MSVPEPGRKVVCVPFLKSGHIWGLLIGRAVTGLSHSKDLHGEDQSPLQATQILNPTASYSCCGRGARRHGPEALASTTASQV